MADIKRQTAYKCTVKQINEEKYVVQQGWEPNYIILNDLKLSRINIIGVIVEKEHSVLTLEDGTGKIEIRLFQEPQKAEHIKVGDVILVIGRPREYLGSRYIVPEILRVVKDKKWVIYRKKELELLYPDKGEEVMEKESQEEPKIDEEMPSERGTNYSQIILETIKKLDEGSGAETEQVIKECKLEDAETFIETLLNEGEIFEIRAGKLKILG